jgi:hypothetical protein
MSLACVFWCLRMRDSFQMLDRVPVCLVDSNASPTPMGQMMMIKAVNLKRYVVSHVPSQLACLTRAFTASLFKSAFTACLFKSSRPPCSCEMRSSWFADLLRPRVSGELRSGRLPLGTGRLVAADQDFVTAAQVSPAPPPMASQPAPAPASQPPTPQSALLPTPQQASALATPASATIMSMPAVKVFKATPLWMAARSGFLQIVRMLIRAGADVNLGRPDFGNTPLFAAVRCGQVAVIKELLQVGSPSVAKLELHDYFLTHPFLVVQFNATPFCTHAHTL